MTEPLIAPEPQGRKCGRCQQNKIDVEPTEPAPTDNGKLISDLTFAILDFANTPGTDGLFFNPDDKVTFFQCHTNAKLTGDFLKHQNYRSNVPLLR